MSHAEKCPVCNGAGKLPAINDGMSTAIPQPITCHGCNGLGWVTIYDTINYPIYPVFPVYPQPWYPNWQTTTWRYDQGPATINR
jgi:hypothetical protein